MRHFHTESVPKTPTLLVYLSNPLVIRQHARLIMSAGGHACVCNQGYSVFSVSLPFSPTGHIPSSLGVILRTTDKIVWANEFERKLQENYSNLFSQNNFYFPDLHYRSLPLMESIFSTAVELTCLIESISTNNPRIEWKKIKNGIPSYVYFQNKISGKALKVLKIDIIQQLSAFQSEVSEHKTQLDEWYI